MQVSERQIRDAVGRAVKAETVVDRVIAWVSPARGVARRRARIGMELSASYGQGGYTGAKRSRAQTSQWNAPALSANAALLPDLATLRDRSRDLARNNPIARGAISTLVTNVVGTGLQVRPRIDRVGLGLSDDQAEAWETAALREFNLWAYTAEADFARTLTFDGLQQIAFDAMLRSGDSFGVKRYLDRPGSVFGLKCQIVEADRVCNPNRAADSATLQAGVEIDAQTGAPVAYHVASRHPDDRLRGQAPLTWTRVAAFGAQSGMRQMLHLFRPLEPGVLRGEPLLAPVIEPLRQLGQYTDAELMAAVVNSCFAVVTKTETGDGVDLPTTGQTDTKNDEILLGEPGKIVDLGVNESLMGFTPGRPSGGFDPFWTAIVRQIGIALGIPHEVLIKHFQSSYSASRAALLDFWRNVTTLRDWHAWNFCQPWYEAVIVEAVARGRLAAPGFFADPAIRAAWCGSEWTGPSPSQIDPLKEVEAKIAAINADLTTRERATVELGGGDWSTNHKQRVREEAARRDGGLIAPPAAPAITDKRAPADAGDEPAQGPSRSA